MEQKVIPIILNGKDSAERMKEITDRLETGIQQLFDSDRYKSYLTTMAKFHNYSFNNNLLIAMQGGQLVAGFNKWKDTFHRTVKKPPVLVWNTPLGSWHRKPFVAASDRKTGHPSGWRNGWE